MQVSDIPSLHVALLLLCLGTVNVGAEAQAPLKQWDRAYGTISSDYLVTAQPTTDGGYILGGTSYGGISGNKTQPSQGNSDYWIVKIDASGQKQWDLTFGGSGYDELSSVRQTTDGGYVLGGSSLSPASGNKSQNSRGIHDYWVVKIDAAGNLQWDKTLGGSDSDHLQALLQTTDGGYILAGLSYSPASGDKTSPNQQTDGWLVKLDSAGHKQWDRVIGGSGNDNIKAIQQTTDGGYILGATSSSPVSGEKSAPSRGWDDYWLVKLNAKGFRQWDRTVGGSEYDIASAVLVAPDGGYIIAGRSYSPASSDRTQRSYGYSDFWIVKFDASGNKQWDQSYGGTDTDECSTVCVTADGGYLLGGYSTSGVSGNKTQPNFANTWVQYPPADYWIVKADALGRKQWDATFGGYQEESLSTVLETPDGGYLLAGGSQSSVSGARTAPRVGLDDFWVVKTTAGMLTAAASLTITNTLQVYPNPAQQHVTLRLSDLVSRKALRLSLFDATGRLVIQRSLPEWSQPELTVDLGQRPTGLYELRLEGEGGFIAVRRIQLQ